jgi:hypothetical protein
MVRSKCVAGDIPKEGKPMWMHRFAISILLGCLLCLATAGEGQPAEKPGFFLLTPQEAKEFEVPGDQWRPTPLTRSISRGPKVVVKRPQVVDTNEGPIIQTGSPTAFIVSFQETRAPIDMESLEISARKGLFSKSLTDRLKPYLHGTAIEAEAVNVPEGRFLIQIEIADKTGERTVETYRLEVKAP